MAVCKVKTNASILLKKSKSLLNARCVELFEAKLTHFKP